MGILAPAVPAGGVHSHGAPVAPALRAPAGPAGAAVQHWPPLGTPQEGTASAPRGLAAPAVAGAAALAAGAAARRAARGARGGQRPTKVARQLQGGVEGVRVVQADPRAAELRGCRNSTVVDGVMKMTFLVPRAYTGPGEEFDLGKGTTENSYVLYEKGGSPDAGPLTIIDVPEARFLQAFLGRVSSYLSRLERLVLTHVGEADIEVVLRLGEEVEKASGSKLKVYMSDKGKSIIANYAGTGLEGLDVVIIDNDSFIPCRSSGRLDAVTTSTGKYPDLMNAFDEETGTLFSGKFFAAHVMYDAKSEDTGWTSSSWQSRLASWTQRWRGRLPPAEGHDPSWQETAEDWHHYFDCSFFTGLAQDGVRRIFQITADNADDGVGLSSPDVTRLAPFHGPIVSSQAWKLMAKYEAWLEKKTKMVNEGNAVVLYASAYSNTFTMAEAIARGLEKAGVTTELLNVEFTDAQDITKAVAQCDGFAVGSPTLGGQMPIQMKEALGIILKSSLGGSQQGGSMRAGSFGTTPCGAFGSFGWSGEAPVEVHQRLKDAGLVTAFEPVRCKFTPTLEMITRCETAGVQLAQAITKAKKQQMRSIVATEQGLGESKLTAKEGTERMLEAFGQIINSSCVMTFKAEEEGGEGPRVPVSWISQASFTPPGLMIALEKKDLDTWLDSSPEEQLNELFKKYDVDGSGELDRKETDPLLTEMFGVQIGTAAEEMLRAKKDEAWKILDRDGSGMVDRAEFLAAAAEGPFSEMIARERKLASFETMLGKELLGPQFTLCMLPEGMNEEEAMSAPTDKKKKPKNGCAAIAGCTSYLECQVRSITAAGASSILYVEVVQGDLVEEDKRTELLRADHVAIDHESADKAAESQGELVPA